MQIIELYIKGYNRLEGGITGFATNKLVDNTGVFNTSVSVGDIVTNKRTHLTATISAIDSDTQLSLSADLFTSPNTDQYIIESDYFRADLFEDESITITDTLLNLKDVGKVFTPFSQQFNLPASKTNNKLFRHYENQNVLNSFDARFKHDAVIKLNGIDYKKGKIQFKSVTLKDNKAHAYKVVFFGDAVVLKEIIGDTTLQGLKYDGAYNFTYNETNIVNFLSAGSSSLISTYGSDDIIVPNIHHSKNMRYSTSNGYKDSITDTGLVYTDLKPAIRLRAIIEAIERTYPELSFTGFFNTFDFSNFYMWMHKNEGYVTNANPDGALNISVNRFRHQDDEAPTYTYNATGSDIADVRSLYLLGYFGGGGVYRKYKATLSISTSTPENYTVRIKRGSNGDLIRQEQYTNQSGTVNIEEEFLNLGAISSSVNNMQLLDLIVEVESENTITMTQNLAIGYKKKVPFVAGFQTQWIANYTPTNQDVENTFEISRQMPDMKVIDFLSGLFKMFNLLVYKDGDNINVQLPKVYYNKENSYDITKYVDMEKATVDRLFQYKKMDFKFKSKESFLVQFSDEIQTVPFAEEDYPRENTPFDGGTYTVELPFEKMMYERLTDTDDDSLTLIGQGSFLNKQFEPTIGEPLIFLSIYNSNVDNELTIGSLTPNAYRRPSNVTGLGWWGYNRRLQMNFGLEADEYLGEIPSNSTNLFEDGYFDYVQTMFDPTSRLFKYTAYLPLSILIKLQLKDRLVIANNSYRINSIKTNLLTNKTELELYNRSEFVSQINNNQFAYLDRVAQVTVSSKTSSFIDITWTAVTGAVGYDVILNGGVFVTTLGNGIKILPLESGTTYNIGVRAKYNISGDDAYSFDTTITETTL